MSVIAPVISRCRQDGYWTRSPRKGVTFKDRPVKHMHWVAHVSGQVGHGLSPMQEGSSETSMALADLDSHQGEIPWELMVTIARQLSTSLALRGYKAHIWRSSGGNGIHILLLWDAPQDAHSVRAMLREVVEANGLSIGTGGLAQGQVEVFPKQDRIPAGGRGNMFVLPLFNLSLPLQPVGTEVIPREEVIDYAWSMSAPVPYIAPPAIPKSYLGELSADVADVAAAVDLIPNYDDDGSALGYDAWRNIIFAIHNGTAGSEEGRQLAHRFSAKSGKYDADFLDHHVWPYIRDRDDGITVGTLFHLATAYGWSPFQATEDDFADLTEAYTSAEDAPRPQLRLVPPPAAFEEPELPIPAEFVEPVFPLEPPPPEQPPAEAPEDQDFMELMQHGHSGMPPPYPGVIQDLVDTAIGLSHTEQPEMLLSAVITGLAAGISGRVVGPTGLRSNLYSLLISPSGTGKDKPLSLASEIAAATGAVARGAPGSGAGLEDMLFASVGDPAAAADTPVFCSADEFARVLKAGGSAAAEDKGNLREILMTLYSASSRTHERRSLASTSRTRPPGTLWHPKLSFMGATSPVSIQSLLSKDDAASGLFARFLVTIGRPAPKRHTRWAQNDSLVLPYVSERTREALAGIAAMNRALQEASTAEEFARAGEHQQFAVQINFTREAVALRNAHEGSVWPTIGAMTTDEDAQRALFSRFSEHVQKVCIVLAVAEDPVLRIVTAEMYRWAVAYVDWCLKNAAAFISSYAAAGLDQDGKRIDVVLKTIERVLAEGYGRRKASPAAAAALKQRCIPRTDLLQLCKISSKNLNDAINTLVEAGKVVVKQQAQPAKKAGRPSVWYGLTKNHQEN